MSIGSELPARYEVVGTPISRTDYDEVIDLLRKPPTDRALVVAVCNVHSVMSARRDPLLSSALRGADIATPDGMPLVWSLRSKGYSDQSRVYGPEIMERTLTGAGGTRHFLYGSRPETLRSLSERARGLLAPGSSIVGEISPPFRQLTTDELDDHCAQIRASAADVVWVGLGMPRQELWMADVAAQLPGMALVGVGAAFDFLAGTVPQAPAWMRDSGLEWLYRLSREPTRLWRRYALTIPGFLLLSAGELIRMQFHRLTGH